MRTVHLAESAGRLAPMSNARADEAMQRKTFDVVVAGAGLAGLAIALRLRSQGHSVCVVEKGGRIGLGSSTQNEGWLHAGTFHATSVRDPVEAVRIAQRCIQGHERISKYAPECVEPEDTPSLAIVHDGELEHALERWDRASVAVSRASRSEREAIDADVRLAADEHVFRVADVGINTRMLFSRYLQDLAALHVPVLLDTRVAGWTGTTLELVQGDHEISLGCDHVVVAAGYGSAAALDELGLPGVGFRYWLSHLCVTPRLSRSAVFSIAAGEAAMMTHGEISITGLNQDATLVDEPRFMPTEEGRAALLRALSARFRHVPAAADVLVTACTKVDFALEASSSRSLNISVTEAAPNVTVALPGKMTETPCVADEVARKVFGALGNAYIALRPMDQAGGLITARALTTKASA